jgi:hypothetical protein
MSYPPEFMATKSTKNAKMVRPEIHVFALSVPFVAETALAGYCAFRVLRG